MDSIQAEQYVIPFRGPDSNDLPRSLEGWKRYKNDPNPRIRERFGWEVRSVRIAYAAVLWAMEQRLKNSNPTLSTRIGGLRQEIVHEFGSVLRLGGRLLGPFLLWTTVREEKRLASGVAYEPDPILERQRK